MAQITNVAAKNKTPRKKFRLSYEAKDWIAGYLFILPVMIFFIGFIVIPMARGIYVSFFDYSLRNFEFIGLDNYIHLFGDEIFLKGVRNTLFIVIGSVPIVVLFALFVSVNIYKKAAAVRSFFRGVFYLPAICSVVSVTVVWGFIYEPNYGVLNYLLSAVGTEKISWLADARFALPAVMAVLITTAVGQPIILYVAALGNVPVSYIEAAEIDGATNWEVFQNITWPMLMPTSLYIIIITTINSFQCFSLIQLLTSGGPAYNTSTIMYQVYERAFTLNQYGLSSAMGVILAIIIMIISIIQYKFFGSDIEY
ncbi:MAG: permease component of ABC-type sugar transporter [Clostridia bacterium]|jgi:multiple sugar transport system permease protein|nr:permease component of ABC-type sugar transporter [Clostridia bacterium]